MSGLKYSKIEYEKELERRKNALRNITESKKNIDMLQQKIKAFQKEIPDGVLRSFQDVKEMMERWLNTKLSEFQPDLNSQELEKIEGEYREMEGRGLEVLKKLIEIKEEKKDEKEKELLTKTEVVKNSISALENLLNKWKPGQVTAFLKEVEGIYAHIKNNNFVEAEKLLSQLEKELAKEKETLKKLELQDELRWYTLESLRKVVKEELGWGEISEPKLENEKDPGSPIYYEVNTYSNGEIKFWLELEKIRVNSEITNEEDMCMNEFDNLSEKLKNFGVLTKFNWEGAPPKRPIGKSKKAKPYSHKRKSMSKTMRNKKR